MKKLLGTLLLFAITSAVSAAPITYTMTGSMGGSLGGSYFSYAEFEINVNADTDTIWVWSGSEPGWPIYENLSYPGDATIDIAGIGSATITQGLIMFARSGDPYACSPCILILNPADINGPAPFVAFDDALMGYDLSNSISASWTDLGFVGVATVPLVTDAGSLLINYSDTFSFSATMVPVPATAWLFGSALGLLGWIRRKKI